MYQSDENRGFRIMIYCFYLAAAFSVIATAYQNRVDAQAYKALLIQHGIEVPVTR
jgi:hypothetical protein